MERIIRQVQFLMQSQPKAKKVVAYARVSTGKDAMLHSLSAQVSYYSELIQSTSGWQYCGVYSDEATTGTKGNRKGFQDMLKQCQAGNIDLIITKSISRFARNTVTLLETVRELKELGVDVYFEEQNIHTMSADGELMMTILASYAQEESLSASENQKWRVRKAFENGELMNLRTMFGYSISKGSITIHPENADIVREIFRRFNEGETMGSISRTLNERGVQGALGGVWDAQRIRQILSNEKYTGNALLQKHYRNNHLEKKKTKNQGELPLYYAEGTHEAIIDQPTFDRAGERLRELECENSKRKRPQSTPFTSRIRCGICGANYKHCVNLGKHFWQCSTYMKKGKQFCHAKRIPDEVIHRLTAEMLGAEEYDADMLDSRITLIQAEENHTIVFRTAEGEEIVKQWKLPSRSESWTAEMRGAASERTKKARKSNG